MRRSPPVQRVLRLVYLYTACTTARQARLPQGLTVRHFLPICPLPLAPASQRRQRLRQAAGPAHALRRATEDPGDAPAANSQSRTPTWPLSIAQSSAVRPPNT